MKSVTKICTLIGRLYFMPLQVALVSQEPVLFARSIRDNISYGSDGLKQDQIEQAAKDANAHCFITELDDQYDTDAGEFGKQLSGKHNHPFSTRLSMVRVPYNHSTLFPLVAVTRDLTVNKKKSLLVPTILFTTYV